jgi:hypothetical protein
MSSAAEDAEKDAAEKLAQKTASDSAAAEAAKDAKSKVADFIDKNPKTALSAAAITLYMIDHGITDPAEAVADMAKETGSGIGGALDGIFASLKKYIWVVIAIPVVILLIVLIMKLIPSK